MTNLNTVFRENASTLTPTDNRATLYLRNDTLDNHKIQLLANPTTALALSTNPLVAAVNNPESNITLANGVNKLDVCLAPFLVNSEFGVSFISSRMHNDFTNKSLVTGNESLSKSITETAGTAKATVYFEYYGEGITVYQTLLISVSKISIDRAISDGQSSTLPVLTYADPVTGNTLTATITEIIAGSVLDNNFYYFPINIPNRIIRRTINVSLDLDRSGIKYGNVTKAIELIITRNETAPYAVINIPSFSRMGYSLSRQVSVAALTSKIYNSKRYVQVTHIAGDIPVEVYVKNTNISRNVNINILTPDVGVIGDTSFIAKTATLTDSNKTEMKFRLRNSRMVIQYEMSLVAVENFNISAIQLVNGVGIGASHAPELGTILSDATTAYADNFQSEGKFAISASALSVGECYSLNCNFILVDNNNPVYGTVLDYLSGDRDQYANPFKWTKGAHAFFSMYSKAKSSTGVSRDIDVIANPSKYTMTIERTATGINIHRFERVGQVSALSYSGSSAVPLPEFSDNAPLYIIVGTSYGYSDTYTHTWPSELSAKFTLGAEDALSLDSSHIDGLSLTSPIDITITDIFME